MTNGTTSSAGGAPSQNSGAPPTNATSSGATPAAHAPPTQRLSTSSNQSNSGAQKQQQQPKKMHSETEKIQQQVNSTNQGHRGGGAKDQRAREKEKNNYRGGNQQHHHTGNQQTNGQNNRKKENKNRDHSSQSHRGGHSFTPYPPNQSIKPADIQELVKPIGFPAPPPVAPPTPEVSEKLVQTDPEEKKEKRKKTEQLKKEKTVDECAEFQKKADHKWLDTVVAFQEHDKWEQVELMCELLNLMDPADLHLMSNCIESSLRCYQNQMKPVEKTANCPEPTASFPPFIVSPAEHSTVVAYGALPPNCATVAIQRHNILNTFIGPMAQPPPGLPPVATGAQLAPAVYGEQPSSSSSPMVKETTNAIVSQQNGAATSSTTPPINQNSDGGEEKMKKSTTTIDSKPITTPSTTSESTLDGTTNLCRQPEPDNSYFVKMVRDIASYLYILMSVCSSTNRKSAARIADYVNDVVLREKVAFLERIPNVLDKIEVLQDIGKIVSAIIHHPATEVDVKRKFTDHRDVLRAETDNLLRGYYTEQHKIELARKFEPSEGGVGREEEEGEESDSTEEEEEPFADSRSRLTSFNYQPHGSTSSSVPPPAFFITRFIGRNVEKNDNAFLIEIHWSDGDRTFTQRTRDQLKAFQHRLLDEFGQQRSEKALGMSTSSFEDESKKLSTSTSTMETNFAMSGERIVPRLSRDATSAQYVQYINELSDLPARMMLSAVICEEFNGTRARTDDETRESGDGLIFSRWKNPRSKSPVRYFERNSAGFVEPVELPVTLIPFSYSNVPRGHLQTLFPSCSNCGGQHAIKNCKKPTILDRKSDQKMRVNNGMSSSSSGNGSSNNHHQMHGRTVSSSHGNANGWRTSELEAPIQINANHFSHHQHQQMIQNNLFHANAAQFRAMPPFENGPQPLFMISTSQAPPPTVAPPPSSSSSSSQQQQQQQQATPTNGAAN